LLSLDFANVNYVPGNRAVCNDFSATYTFSTVDTKSKVFADFTL
jgi:hypothetical protein